MTIRYQRLTILFLRSRMAVPVLLVLTAVAVAAGFALDASNHADLTLLLRMTAPLAAAIAVGVSVRSPFGEAERTASQPLPPLRFAHLTLLLAYGVAGFALASVVPNDGSLGMLLRNGAGFVGLALIGAWMLGTAASWLLPLAYGGGVYFAYLTRPVSDAWWRWPVQPAGDGSALAIALSLLAVGLAIVVTAGARDGLDEGE
jgi:hypothetical protein